MNKVVKILRGLGEALAMLILIIVAAVILLLVAIPVGIVLIIGDTISFMNYRYDEHKKNNSADMCDKESAEDSASSSDAARDTAGAEDAGSDKEF